jgi:FkbM family methyltransferase
MQQIKRRLGFRDQIKRKFDKILLSFLDKKHRSFIQDELPQLCVSNFDHISTRINYFGRYERDLLDFAFEFISVNFPDSFSKSALDAGANIGNHSLFFSKFYKRVYSFEPVGDTYEILKMNTKNIPNISVHNVALSEENGELGVCFDTANIGSARVVNEKTDETIRSITLDNFVISQTKQSYGLLKMDVEGHELSLLKGATEFLVTHKPIVIFEMLDRDFVNGNNSYEYLKSLGYSNFFEVADDIHITNRFMRYYYLFFGKEIGVIPIDKIDNRTYNLIIAVV